jgi:hypothetical protein
MMEDFAPLELTASDVSGQRRVQVRNVAGKATVAELVRSLVARLGLIREDAAGRPLTYRARLERQGRTLNGSELIGEALKPQDKISLYPHIQAGGGATGLAAEDERSQIADF